MSSEINDDDFELFTSVRYDPVLMRASWKPSCDEAYCPFLLFFYHLDRLAAALQHFEWEDGLGITMDDPNVYQDVRERVEQETWEKEHGDGYKPLRVSCFYCVKSHHLLSCLPVLQVRLVISPSTGFRVECFPTAERSYDLLSLSTFNPTSSTLPSPPFPEPTRVYLDSSPTPVSDFTLYKTTRREHYDAARERVGLKPSTTDGEVLLFNEEGNITEGSIRNVAFWRDGKWVSPDDGGLEGVVLRWLVEQGRVTEGTVSKEDVKIGEMVLLMNGVEGCTLGVITEGRYPD